MLRMQLKYTPPRTVLKQTRLLTEFRPIWPTVTNYAKRGFGEIFRAEGPGWPAQSPMWAARKGGGQLMVQTGALRAKLTGSPKKRQSKRKITFAAPAKYAGAHYGTKKGVPGRPVVWLNTNTMRHVLRTMHQHIERTWAVTKKAPLTRG